jgi:type IV secretory pathway ATPase VirB11/archaellum biosynthesis ATPase
MKESPHIRRALKIADKHKAYAQLFRPVLIPELIPAGIGLEPPEGKAVENYSVGDVKISIYRLPHRPDCFYFVNLPELRLNNEQMKILDGAFKELCEEESEINFNPKEIRKEFRKLIDKILEHAGKDREMLANILLRHTAGYGIMEPVLSDDKIQDAYIDSGSGAVHIVHATWGECLTNLEMSKEELEKLVTRMRAVSGRPLDASSPVLHAELEDLGIRVCGICEPSTYRGTGFAFRRRKSEPWTLPEFIAAGMLDAKTAGLLSFLVDGQSSILVTGPRASGKTSLLTALLLEIPQNSRIIMIEDTPEIPIGAMQELGYKVEHLKTEAFAKGFELSTEDALRTSLRLGESTLVIGEVRGSEAKSLFEAMRIGAAGNVVLGTIHSASAYDTWDRVVNDLGVPSTSFKAVDAIITTGSIRFGDDVRKHRRLLDVNEVRKDWSKEPKFTELIKFKRKSDSWALSLGNSFIIRKISEVKGLSLKQAKQSIEVRSKIKGYLVKKGKRDPKFMSAEWNIAANNQYARLASETRNYGKVWREWQAWAKKVMK